MLTVNGRPRMKAYKFKLSAHIFLFQLPTPWEAQERNKIRCLIERRIFIQNVLTKKRLVFSIFLSNFVITHSNYTLEDTTFFMHKFLDFLFVMQLHVLPANVGAADGINLMLEPYKRMCLP